MAEPILYESKPNGKIVVVWLMRKIFYYSLFALFVFLIAFYKGFRAGEFLFFSNPLFWEIVVGLIVLIFIYDFFLYKTYHYKITDKGIYSKGGIVTKREQFAPFYKVTNIEASQSLTEQLCKLYTLNIQTAGEGDAIAEIAFEGLTDVETPKKVLLQKSKQK